MVRCTERRIAGAFQGLGDEITVRFAIYKKTHILWCGTHTRSSRQMRRQTQLAPLALLSRTSNQILQTFNANGARHHEFLIHFLWWTCDSNNSLNRALQSHNCNEDIQFNRVKYKFK